MQIFNGYAQDKTISLDVKKVAFTSVLKQIENTFDVRFSYNDSIVSTEKITLQLNNETLSQTINILNKKTDFVFEIISERNIIIQNRIIEKSKSQLLNEIVLKNYLTPGIEKQKDGSFHITPKKLDILPGITEPDVFQSLQLLPGVISINETATDIHVRGGSPDQNLILWDGIKIYHSGHLFGSISAFNPYLSQNTQFINKGTDAKYGDRVSSIIDIQTPNKVVNNFNGGFGLTLLNADAFIIVPIIKNKLSILFSARRSLTDIIESRTYKNYAEKIFQNSPSNKILNEDNSLRYFDYNIKANWNISPKDIFNFSFLYLENELDNDYHIEQANTSFNDNLETENVGYSMQWKKNWNPKLSHRFSNYLSNYQLSYRQNDESNIFLKKENTVLDFGFSFHIDYQIKNNQKLGVGYQYSNNHIKYITSSKDLPQSNINNNNILNSHALYASYHYKNEKLFNVDAGLRFNYFENISNFIVEPRININKKITSKININLTAEKKTQAVSQINETIEESFLLENQIWLIANKQIPIIENLQFTGGLSYMHNNWHIDIDGYLKNIGGVTALNNGFIDTGEFGFTEGESTVKGVDFYLKKQFKDYNTWVSYTLSSIKNQFEGLGESNSFPANTDVRHNFNWSHQYTYKNLKFSLGWRWHSGKPYSKAIAIKTGDNGNDYLAYEGINTQRLPNYNRLDFSSTYTFDISQKTKVKVGISVINLLDKESVLNRTYTINNDLIDAIDTKSLSRTANVVVRFFW